MHCHPYSCRAWRTSADLFVYCDGEILHTTVQQNVSFECLTEFYNILKYIFFSDKLQKEEDII